MNFLLDPVAALGRATLALVRHAGALTLFALLGLSHLVRPPFYWRVFVASLIDIAYYSLPVVALTAVFSGGTPNSSRRMSVSRSV